MIRLSRMALGLFTSGAIAQPNFPELKVYPPDEVTLKEIAAKTAELKAAIRAFNTSNRDLRRVLAVQEAEEVTGQYAGNGATNTNSSFVNGCAIVSCRAWRAMSCSRGLSLEGPKSRPLP